MRKKSNLEKNVMVSDRESFLFQCWAEKTKTIINVVFTISTNGQVLEPETSIRLMCTMYIIIVKRNYLLPDIVMPVFVLDTRTLHRHRRSRYQTKSMISMCLNYYRLPLTSLS